MKKIDVIKTAYIDKSHALCLVYAVSVISACYVLYYSNLLLDKYEMTMYAVMLLISNALMCIKTRKSPITLVLSMLITYFNYSICYMYYFAGQETLPQYQQAIYAETAVKNEGIFVLLIFNVCMLYFMPVIKCNKTFFYQTFEWNQHINTLTYVILAALISICIFGMNRQQNATSYYGAATSLYEYGYILFIFALYCAREKKTKALTCVVAIVYVLQDLYYGGRITAIQVSLIFICFYANKLFNFVNIAVAFFACLVVMTAVSWYRASYSFTHIVDGVAWEYIKATGMTVDTAYYAYHSSLSCLKAEEFLGIGQRLQSFMGMFFNVFGIKIDVPLASWNTAANSVGYYNQGGGVFPVIFSFWFGPVGALIVSIAVLGFWRLLEKKIMRNNSDLAKLCLIGIVTTFPRWYLYSPLQFFKTSMVLVPVLWTVLKIFEKAVWCRGRFFVRIKEKSEASKISY